MSSNNFSFSLFLGITPYTVYPVWGDSMKLNIVKEDGEEYFRAKLSEPFIFQRENFDLINEAPFDTRFRLYIEESSNPGTAYWEGIFYKTDCKEWDLDERSLEVLPEPLDNYTKVLGGMEKEFNLVDLAPERETVRYEKQPVIQIYLPGANFLMNYLDGTWWEQPVIAPSEDTVIAIPGWFFGFDSIPNTVKTFIAGDDLVPDVSGQYIQDGIGGVEHIDGTYGLVYQDLGSGDQWTIVDRINANTVVYTGPVGETVLISLQRSHSNQAVLLSSVTSASQCRMFASEAYARYLTDELIVDGVPTEELPVDDITADSFGFKRVLPLEINELIPWGGASDDPTPYGKFADDATNNAGRYFTAPPGGPGGERVYPILRSEWTEVSWWFYYTPALRDLQEDGAEQLFVRHAYPIASVIKVMLQAIAPGIFYNETADYSDFLHSEVNPVTMIKNKRLFITQKRHIKVGDYDLPSKRSQLKFSELLEFLRSAYKLYWHIDPNGYFRLEHKSWYEKGGSYGAPIVSIDLTTFVEPKTRKNWDYRSRIFSYDKVSLPEQLSFSWMDKTTAPFDGYNIEIVSAYVQDGNIQQNDATKFTTDISFIIVQPGAITDDGFVAMACEDDITGQWFVPFVELSANGEDYKLQNGWLSYIYLHPAYHRHGLPAEDVTINNETAIVLSVQKFKRQKLTFPFASLEPRELIQTNLGLGQADNFSITLVSGSSETEILQNET